METVNAIKRDAYSFTLVYEGIVDLTREFCDAIYEAGCDDALLGIVNGRVILDFDRQAASFQEALLSAIASVDRAGQPIRLIRVEPL